MVTNPDLAADEAKAVICFSSARWARVAHGDQHIANLFGMDPHTVAHGRRELVEGDWVSDRLRAPGGGRPTVKKKRRKSSSG